MVPAGAKTCPECGAPIDGATATDAEAVVYPELAKANLARMRGDYKQAEDQLLSVLKRFPNNPSANEMLGDLAAEREDFVHAAEWYEMALEVLPTSASIARKLAMVRGRVEQKDARDTTAQLGLPDPSSRVPLIVGALIIVFVAAISGAYFLGAKAAGNGRVLPQPIWKINAVGESNPQSGTQPAEAAPKATTENEDESLLIELKSKSADASGILAATVDPRSGGVTITFQMSGKEDRALAARIARDAFSLGASYGSVTLRGMANGRVAYMADSSRAKMAQTEAPEWKLQHKDAPDAWIAEVLINEWPAPASPPVSPPANNVPPPGAETPANSGNTTTPPTDRTGATSGGG